MSGDRRLLAYVAALLAATVGTVAAARVFQLHSAGPAVWWAFPILALGLIAAGYLRVKFRRGDDIDALTLFEAVLAPLIFAFPPTVVVLTVAGAHIVVAALRRTTWIKAAFNVVQWSLAAAVGSAVLSALVDGPGMSLESLGWLVIALACVALVNNLAFTLVLSISGRQPVRTVVRGLAPALGWGWLGWGFNVLIGLLFVLAYAGHPIAVVLFPVPLFVLHLAYRGYAAERSDRARLAGLRQAVFTLSAPLQPREAIGDYLREVSETFESHGAGLILLTDGGDFDIHVLEGTGDVTVHTESQQAVSLECLLAAQPEPLRVTSTASNAIAPLLVRSGWRDCICAPLVDDQRRLGALVVFDQIGLEGDTMSDLAVLDALARETAHTIARGRMFESVAEERRKLDQIVGSTSDGIFTLGDDGTVLTWNSGCERITGLAAVDVVGRRHVLRRLRARTALDTPIDFAAWAADPTLPAEVLITRDNGEVRRLSCAATPATNVDGPSQTLVVVARDITPATEYQELREQFSRLVEAQEAQRLVVDHLQQAVTPEPPGIDGVDLAVTYVASDPSSPTGGDLFDWRLLPTGALHICVVDVLGHGVAATKDALTVVHTLRFTAVEGVPLEQMVRRADDLLSAQVSELVATVVIARYDPETGELEVVSGGHPPALVVGADGEVTQLAATGCAIGWPEAGSDNIAKSTLGINDSLVLYTDGLIEARKDVLEGMDSLMEHAGEVAQLPAEQFADELVERSLAGANRRDDSLAMVLRRTRPQVVPHRMRWNVAPGSELALRTARAGLEEWLLSHRVRPDNAVLIAAELLANSVVAARSDAVLTALLDGSSLVLEVSDDGPGDEHLEQLGEHLPVVESEHGRGLFLVRSLSEDVSIMSTAEGTVVRSTVSVERMATPVRQGQWQLRQP